MFSSLHEIIPKLYENIAPTISQVKWVDQGPSIICLINEMEENDLNSYHMNRNTLTNTIDIVLHVSKWIKEMLHTKDLNGDEADSWPKGDYLRKINTSNLDGLVVILCSQRDTLSI